ALARPRALGAGGRGLARAPAMTRGQVQRGRAMSPLRLVGVATAFALGGCATAAAPGRYDLKTVRNHEMSPYVIHEECLKVAAGERIEYYFTSTFPINFNIHYHEANAVLMPI